MRFSWLACYDPVTGTERMSTWVGDTIDIVITGLPPGFAASAPMAFELPGDIEIHPVPPRDRNRHGVPTGDEDPGRRLANLLGGVLFTVFSGEMTRIAAGAFAGVPVARASLSGIKEMP